ncbi:hypothetical protein Tco_1158067 [Tanacetum coccineum]
MSRMDDDLFTYEVEIPGLASVPCDLNNEDDSEQHVTHGYDDDMEYDPSNVEFTKWLASKFYNHKTMDHYTKNALWIYWARGDDEVELTNEESSNSDDEDKVAKIFRIDTNMCLPKILRDLRLTKIIRMIGFMNEIKMCHGCMKNHGRRMDWKDDGYCNGGNLPGAYIVRNTLRYQDLEWYEALEDGKLKEEALKNKAIMEGIINEDDESSNEGWRRWDDYENDIHVHEKRKNEEGMEAMKDANYLITLTKKLRFAKLEDLK